MNNKNNQGFTLIELMIVIAIIAILASVAIPAYEGFISRGKVQAMTANYTTAVRLVRNEIAKKATGGRATTDILAILNAGNRTSPTSSTLPAFAQATTNIADQIGINIINLNTATPGDVVTVFAPSGTDPEGRNWSDHLNSATSATIE